VWGVGEAASAETGSREGAVGLSGSSHAGLEGSADCAVEGVGCAADCADARTSRCILANSLRTEFLKVKPANAPVIAPSTNPNASHGPSMEPSKAPQIAPHRITNTSTQSRNGRIMAQGPGGVNNRSCGEN